MTILKWLARGLLLLIASLSITLWVSATTLSMTLLNRQAMFGWLDASGAYAHVGESVISLQQPPQNEDTALSVTALQTAIGKTLSPDFVKQVTETVLGGIYDWLQGKTAAITFSIDLADKRQELKQHLAAELQSQFTGLPTCRSNLSDLASLEDVQCLPPGSNAADMASTVAGQAVEGSDFLTKPLTPDMLGVKTDTWQWLPKIVQLMPVLVFGLPVLALLCAAGYVFLSHGRLAGMRVVTGRIFFGTLLTTIGGGLVWYFGSRVHVADAIGEAGQLGLVSDVVEPVVHQIAPAIGAWVTLLAGCLALITGGLWITTLVLLRRKKITELTKLADDTRHSIVAPAKPADPKPVSVQAPKATPPKPAAKKIQ